MKQKFKWAQMLLCMMLAIAFTACDKNDKESDEPQQPSQQTNSIVGKWSCKYNAYGDPWHEPLIYMFYDDGTGYEWFSDEPYSDRCKFKYETRSSRIDMYFYDSDELWEKIEAEFKLSSNGKSLTLIGLDDNDMSELHFTRVE